MGVELEFTFGKRVFHKPLRPGRCVTLGYEYGERPVSTPLVPAVRIITESVTVQPSGNAVMHKIRGGRHVLFGNEINEENLTVNTVMGSLFNAKVVYRGRTT